MFKKWLCLLCVLIGSVAGQTASNMRNFSSNPLTEEDKTILRHFIEDFANNSLEKLMENKSRLEENVTRFSTINPLILTSFFFSEPSLQQSAKKIIQTEGKSSILLFALALEIDEAIQNGSIDQYISEFANLLQLDKNIIKNHIDEENYKDLVYYMLRM